jgi:ankyrin repeat protein
LTVAKIVMPIRKVDELTSDDFSFSNHEAFVRLALREKYIMNELHSACKYGNFDIVYELLTPFNINTQDQLQQTLMHKAVKSGNLTLVKLLAHAGIETNRVDVFGNTPLIYAIKQDRFDIVKQLTRFRCNLNGGGCYSFQYASNLDFVSNSFNVYFQVFMHYFVHFIHKIDWRSLVFAVRRFYQVLDKNSSRSASIRESKVLRKSSNKLKNPLTFAILRSNYEISHYLLMNNANPNRLDHNGLRPLHCAAICNNERMLRMLIKFNANVNLKSKNGLLPLHFSCLTSINCFNELNIKCIKYLLKCTSKRRLNDADEFGYTPLDRLWCKMNSISIGRIQAKDKLRKDNLLVQYRALMQRLIERGCRMRKYLCSPQTFGSNYYATMNAIKLLESLFKYGRPSLDYAQQIAKSLISPDRFMTEVFEYLIEKIAIKYSFLVKEYTLNESINSEDTLLTSELCDCIRELIALRKVIYIIISSGELFSSSKIQKNPNSNTQIFLNVFGNQANAPRQANVEICERLEAIKTLSLHTIIELRELVRSHIYSYFMQFLNKPFKLQELCRMRIRLQANLLNKDVMTRQLNLPKVLVDYLFYD